LLSTHIEPISHEDHAGLAALFHEFALFEKLPDKMVNTIGFYRSLGAQIDDIERNCDLTL
jgi:hypothetical protein